MTGIKEFFRRPKEETTWERARRVMEEKGGKVLIIKLADELRAEGDRSAIVVEELAYRYGLTLRFDLKPCGAAACAWQSKGVRLIALSNGEIDVEWNNGMSFYPFETVGKIGYGPVYDKLPDNSVEMSLEEKARFAMRAGGHDLDFRYGEGKQSCGGIPVKSNLSRRIY